MCIFSINIKYINDGYDDAYDDGFDFDDFQYNIVVFFPL